MKNLSFEITRFFIVCSGLIFISLISFSRDIKVRNFKLALIQMYVQPGNKEANLKIKAETIIYVDIIPVKRPTWGTGWAKYKPIEK